MKYMKLITLILILTVVFTSTAYAAIDWASMSNEELENEVANGMAEMMNRGYYIEEPEAAPEPTEAPKDDESKNPNKKEGKATLLKTKDVTVTATVFEVSDYEYNLYTPTLYVRYIAENNSNRDFEAHIDNVAINDWEVDRTGYISVGAGHSVKDEFELKMEDANVSTLQEIKKVTFSFYYEDADGESVTTKPKNIILNK